MKKFRYTFLYLLEIHIFALILTAIFRAVLLWVCRPLLNEMHTAPVMQFKAFLYGVWFDNVIGCYILIIPLAILLLAATFGVYHKALFRATNLFFGICYTAVFAISAADIPFFEYFFSHLNTVIFQWTDYSETTFGMLWGEKSYRSSFFLFAILTIAFSCFLHFRRVACIKAIESSEPKRTSPIQRITMGTLSLLLIGGCLFGIRGRMGYNPIRVSAAYFCNNTLLNQLGISPSFNFMRSLIESSKTENQKLDLMDDKQAFSLVQQYFGNNSTPPGYLPTTRKIEYTTPPLRKNIVIVLMESMSANFMGRYGNTQKLTPFLDSIAQQSLTFDRTYSAGTHTNHGLMATLYAYPALMKRNIMKSTVISSFSGLPNVLQKNGYQTLFFMPHESQYDNMNGFLKSNGFSYIYAQENYPAKEVVNSFGVPDKYLYDYALSTLDQSAKQPQPFLSVILTVSNHPPYIVPKERKFVSSKPEEQMVEYADQTLCEFYRKVKQKSWFKNTIFVFIADHGKMNGVAESEMPLSYNHIPMIIHAPHLIEPESNSTPAGQIDLYPTLLGVLNFDHTNQSFGIDLLREKRPYIYFTSDQSIGCIDNSYFYINNPNEQKEWLYEVNNGKVSSATDNVEESRLRKQYVSAMMQAAQTIVSDKEQQVRLQ